MKTALSLHYFLFFLILSFSGNAQMVLVSGTVLNQNSGKNIENVNIFESISGIGTISNQNGFFSLMLKPGNAKIVFSLEGFNELTQKIIVKNDTTLSVSMVPATHLKSKQKETDNPKTAEMLKKSRK